MARLLRKLDPESDTISYTLTLSRKEVGRAEQPAVVMDAAAKLFEQLGTVFSLQGIELTTVDE